MAYPHQKNSTARRKIRARVLERDGSCVYCGTTEGLTVDHVVPRVHGGGYTASNLVAACGRCNRQRGGERWHGPVHIHSGMRDEQRRAMERVMFLRLTGAKPGPDGR